MVRRKVKKKNTILGYKKKYVYFSLVIGVLMLMVGGATMFSTFGISSSWGADAEFNSISYFDELIEDVSDLPDYAFNIGSRSITPDFDGKPLDTYDWDAAPVLYNTRTIYYNSEGMSPTINYDIGRFKYFSNLTEEIAEVTGYPVIKEDETMDVHYYFGFSVGFSTAAYRTSIPELRRMFVPSEDSTHAWYSESLVESEEVSMTTSVALRFESILSGGKIYNGTLNEVRVYRERGYYLSQPVGYDYDTIEGLNSGYTWNGDGYQVLGSAFSNGPPEITYGIIDSATEKMATIELGATLRPAIDPTLMGAVVNTPEAGLEGYITVSAMDTYNVGYIYDLVVDVSLNGIPLVDPDADWLLGRFAVTWQTPLPLPWYLNQYVLLLAGLLAFFLIPAIFCGNSKRKS